MANFWNDAVEFWSNKTKDNETYEAQKREVQEDLARIIRENGIKRVIDVGGYKGRMGEGLDPNVEYQSIDFATGFDLTKDWEEQGLELKPDTLCFTSITLICFDEPTVTEIIKQMWKYSPKVLYLFEEARLLDHGKQVNGDFGGKWSHIWSNYFVYDGITKNFITAPSNVNPVWSRMAAIRD